MRYTKHLFIRFLGCCLFIALWQTLGSCTNEADGVDTPIPDKNIPLTIEITAESFDEEADASPSTRYSESGNTTIFEKTDTIGLFAVRNIGTPDAVIIDGIDNIQLKYIPAADASASSEWVPVDATNILYYYADVTYVAYYPYKKGITIVPTQSVAAIRTSFTEMAELQPAADQSTEKAHRASDLMTASAKAVDTDDPTRKHLLLNFTHSYSLLVLKTNIAKRYIAPPGQGFTYHPQALASKSADPNADNTMIQGIKAFKKADGVFRTIVKPYSGNISGTYSTSNVLVDYDCPLAVSSITAGKIYECEVNTTMRGADQNITRALQPCDLVLQKNGKIEIYPGDGAVDANGRIPDYQNAVGIVTTCDPARMTDTECNAKGWTHAYVMGLFINRPMMQWCKAGKQIPYTETTNSEAAKNNMNGYTESQIALKRNDLIDYPVFNTLKSTSYEGNRSPWFLPGSGQWYDAITHLSGISPDDFEVVSTTDGWWTGANPDVIYNGINAHLKKINNKIDQYTAYPCSSQYELKVWYVNYNGNYFSLSLKTKALTDFKPIFFFAF